MFIISRHLGGHRLSTNHHRMFKKAVQQGRSERKAEAYAGRYVEALSVARTTLEVFFNIRLMSQSAERGKQSPRQVIGALSIAKVLASQEVVEDSPIRGLVCVGVLEVHPIALNSC
jgi:hypothetical protein